MLCTLSFSENNSIPRATKGYHSTVSDGGLGDDIRSKICSWYNFLLHCMYNCMTGFCYTFLSQIYQIVCFFVEKLYLNVSSHHKFSFLIDSLKPCTPDTAIIKCDKSFLLVFPNTSFPFLTDSLKHPAKCDKGFLLVFLNAVCIC